MNEYESFTLHPLTFKPQLTSAEKNFSEKNRQKLFVYVYLGIMEKVLCYGASKSVTGGVGQNCLFDHEPKAI